MSVLADVFNEKRVPFIFIIDEWDCVFRDTGEILLVGINYDKESKKHDCMIEKLKNKSGHLPRLFYIYLEK